METLINFISTHQGVCLLVGYAIFSNAVAAMPTVESMTGKTTGQIFYEWFYKFVTGLAQMIPKQQPRAGVSQLPEGGTLQQTAVVKTVITDEKKDG